MFLFCEDGGKREEKGQGLLLPVFQVLGQDCPLYLEFKSKVSRGFLEQQGNFWTKQGTWEHTTSMVCSQTIISTTNISVKSGTCSISSLGVMKGCSPNHLQRTYRWPRHPRAYEMLIRCCLLCWPFSSPRLLCLLRLVLLISWASRGTIPPIQGWEMELRGPVNNSWVCYLSPCLPA